MPLSFHERKGIVIIIILFSAGVAANALMDAANMDLDLAGLFYRAGAAHEGWVFSRDFPWGLLYDYGEWPAIIPAIGCLGLLAGSASRQGPPEVCPPLPRGHSYGDCGARPNRERIAQEHLGEAPTGGRAGIRRPLGLPNTV